MGTRGPKPMPANVRLLTGNRGKRPITNNAGMIALDIESPDCPMHLSAEAKREWKRIVPELLKMRVLTQADRAVLESYCENYSLWVRTCLAKCSAETPQKRRRRRPDRPHAQWL